MIGARMRPAALLDRDGTIIVDRHYLADPDAVELLPGAVEAIRMLASVGIPTIVCSNQSGIARGLVTLEQYRAVRLALEAKLEAEGARLLDSFVCPHHELFTGPCECRKPGTLLFRQAASLHAIDLSRSLFAGDKHRDVAPASAFGGRGYLIHSADTPADDVERAQREGVPVVDSLLDAARAYLQSSR